MQHDNIPLFSVIVPVYKVEKYIHQCVDSILAQTFADFEVILVDDGSPDNCGAICDEYAAKDPRVKVVHKENGGLVSARRAGYGICTGRYICNVDSDDYIAPDLLATVVEKLRNYSVDAVLFGYVRFDDCSKTQYLQPVKAGLYAENEMDKIRANLVTGADYSVAIHNGLWSLVMRKERIDPYFTSFPKEICRGEDMVVTVPALNQCTSVYVLEECLYYYRITPGSIMNSHKGNELDQALLLAEYLLERMGETYRQKLDTYILRECANHLSFYRENWREYHRETLKMRNYRFYSPLQTKLLGEKTGILDQILYFLLRYRLYNTLWLLWKIRSYMKTENKE